MPGNANAIKAGAAYVELTLKRVLFERGLKQAQRNLDGFARRFLAVGASLLGVGTGLALPFGLSIKSFSDLDDALRFIEGTAEDAGVTIDQLKQKIRKLGRETSFTISQIGDAAVQLSLAGFSKKEIDESLGGILNLARSTRTDLAEAAFIAAKALRGFGLESSEMNRVVDVLSATASGSAQKLGDLHEAIKLVSSFGQSGEAQRIEEIAGAFGILANNAYEGSLAGTSVRRIFTNLATKSDEIFNLTGVKTADKNGDIRNFIVLLEEISQAIDGLGTKEKTNILNEIFEVRGLSSAKQITKNVDELKQFISKLKDASGSAESLSRHIDRGIGGSLRLGLSAIEGFGNAIGEAISKPTKLFIDIGRDAINQVSGFIDENKELVQVAAGVVVAIVGVGASFLGVGVALSVSSIALTGWLSIISAVITAASVSTKVLLTFASSLTIVSKSAAGLAALSKFLATIASITYTATAAIQFFTLNIGYLVTTSIISKTALAAQSAVMGTFTTISLAAAAATSTFSSALVSIATGSALVKSGFASMVSAIASYIATAIKAITTTTGLIVSQGAVRTSAFASAAGIAFLNTNISLYQTAAKVAAAVSWTLNRSLHALAAVLAKGVVLAFAAATYAAAHFALRLGASATFVSAQISKMTAAVGTYMLTNLTSIFYNSLKTITSGISLIANGLIGLIASLGAFVASGIAQVSQFALTFAVQIGGTVMSSIAAMVGALTTSAASAIATFGASLVPIIAAGAAAFAGFLAVMAAVSAVGVGLYVVYRNIGEIGKVVASAFNSAMAAGKSFVSGFLSIIGEIIEPFTSIFVGLESELNSIGGSFGNLGSELVGLFNQFFGIGKQATKQVYTLANAMTSFKDIVKRSVELAIRVFNRFKEHSEIVGIAFKVVWLKTVIVLQEYWVKFLESVGKQTVSVLSGIGSEVTAFAVGVIKVIGFIWSGVKPILETFESAFIATITAILAAFRLMFAKSGLGFKQLFQTALTAFKLFARSAVALVNNMIDKFNVISIFGGGKGISRIEVDFDSIGDSITGAFDSLSKSLDSINLNDYRPTKFITNSIKESEEALESLKGTFDGLDSQFANFSEAERKKLAEQRKQLQETLELLKKKRDDIIKKDEEKKKKAAKDGGGMLDGIRKQATGSTGAFGALAARRLGVGGSIQQKLLDNANKQLALKKREIAEAERNGRLSREDAKKQLRVAKDHYNATKSYGRA